MGLGIEDGRELALPFLEDDEFLSNPEQTEVDFPFHSPCPVKVKVEVEPGRYDGIADVD